MRLSKIYTRTGDQGSTKLADGSSLSKSHCRIEAYGSVDELNSFLALLRDAISGEESLLEINKQILRIQNELFDLGGELASPAELVEKLQFLVDGKSIATLESEIDSMNESLPNLKNFVLPGGHQANSLAHVCRTICRRAERRVHELSSVESIRPEPLQYLNRLSDWFFVASRKLSLVFKVDEVLWDQRPKK